MSGTPQCEEIGANTKSPPFRPSPAPLGGDIGDIGGNRVAAIGKLEFRQDTLRVLEPTGFEPLDITARHADRAGSLPLHHADPFDRLLISQASLEGLVLVSQDRKFLPYGVPLLDEQNHPLSGH